MWSICLLPYTHAIHYCVYILSNLFAWRQSNRMHIKIVFREFIIRKFSSFTQSVRHPSVHVRLDWERLNRFISHLLWFISCIIWTGPLNWLLYNNNKIAGFIVFGWIITSNFHDLRIKTFIFMVCHRSFK